MFLYFYTGADMCEAEVRLTVTGSIVKGICRLTGCVFAAEESVSKCDRCIAGRHLDLGGSSLQNTPQQQKSVSEDVIPDYKLFKIESKGGSNVVTIIEVKTRTNFNDSVCQTIGYHMASRVSTANEETKNPYPSLAIMICETHARLIFFPFLHENSLCMEAVVSVDISVLPDGMINPALITFVCTYIDQLTNAKPVFITQTEVSFSIHPMKQYHQLLSLEVNEVARLRQKAEEDQQKLQEMSQKLVMLQNKKSQWELKSQEFEQKLKFAEQQLKEMQV